jgi:hypothetical protein
MTPEQVAVADLRIGLAHAARGRRVFPWRLVRQANSKARKTPLVGWQDEPTTDESTIMKWAKKYPGASWGWLLPPGYVVADLDDREAFAASGRTLPPAPGQMSRFSGGEHRLYVTTDPDPDQSVKDIPGLDTRVGGKGWIALYSEDAFEGEPPEAPAWLVHPKGPKAKLNGAANGHLVIEGASPAIEAVESGKLYIPAGKRDDMLASIAGSLIEREAGIEAVVMALGLIDAAGAIEQPPGDRKTEEDFRRIATSIARKDARGHAEAEGEPTDAIGVSGAWVLSDVRTGPPPPRRYGRWDAGHNVIYGRGGVGKGLKVADDICTLVSEGERVLIIDFEDHPDEWARRIQSLGGTDIRAAVLHVSPLDPERWKGRTGAIWDIAPRLREVADAFDASWVVVDSISPACYGTDISAPGTPQAYGQAIALIGRTAISIGQVNRAGDLRYPFGSVLWHYQVRASWSIETPPGGTRGTNLLLTDRKANNYAQAERVQCDVTWWEDLPRRVDELAYHLALAERIAIVLAENAKTAAEITADLNEEAEADDDKVLQATVRQTLNRGLIATTRHPQRFTAKGTGKTAAWSLSR